MRSSVAGVEFPRDESRRRLEDHDILTQLTVLGLELIDLGRFHRGDSRASTTVDLAFTAQRRTVSLPTPSCLAMAYAAAVSDA